MSSSHDDYRHSDSNKRKREDESTHSSLTLSSETAAQQRNGATEADLQLQPPESKRQKMGEISDVVKSHYDARPNSDVVSREKSPIIQVRHFNNWIKSVLIGQYVRPGDTVLDICGGKGGDLPKWNHGGIHHLVLADIAKESVKHAMERFNENASAGKMHFSLDLIAADCCTDELIPLLDRTERWFDLVNCQFALHYSFEDEERAKGLLRNVSHRLKPGGWFIGTIPSAGWIMEKLRKSEGTSFGNDIYRVTFEQRDLAPPRFGAKYKFFLEDAVGDVPEYLVHTETLMQIAKMYDMDFIMSDTLWNFYQANKEQHADLLRRMRVHDNHGQLQLSESGKELSGLYKVFVFRKRGTPEDYRIMDQRGGRIDYAYRQYIPPELIESDIMEPPKPHIEDTNAPNLH